MKNSFSIQSDFVNSRLDRWFRRNVCDVPQSLIEKNIRIGNIKVNNKKEKSSYKLRFNDVVLVKNVNFKQKIIKEIKKNYIPTKKDLFFSSDIFIENNENFVVINKPSGISVQSGTKSKKNIIDILRKSKEFLGFTPYTVHRIDKDTSGILIVAKNRKYAQLFTSLFRIRKIYKTYLGIALGEQERKNGTFKDLLFYYEGKKKTKVLAITHYKVIDTNYSYSLLKLNPETGRKHQLRKQLLIHGTPILGDSKYKLTNKKTNKKSSLMLHAHKIYFLINEIKYNFTADPPDYFNKALMEKNLKISS